MAAFELASADDVDETLLEESSTTKQPQRRRYVLVGALGTMAVLGLTFGVVATVKPIPWGAVESALGEDEEPSPHDARGEDEEPSEDQVPYVLPASLASVLQKAKLPNDYIPNIPDAAKKAQDQTALWEKELADQLEEQAEALNKKAEEEKDTAKKEELKKQAAEAEEKAKRVSKTAQAAVKAAQAVIDIAKKCATASGCTGAEMASAAVSVLGSLEPIVTLFSKSVGAYIPAVAAFGQLLAGLFGQKPASAVVPTLTVQMVQEAAEKALRSYGVDSAIDKFETLTKRIGITVLQYSNINVQLQKVMNSTKSDREKCDLKNNIIDAFFDVLDNDYKFYNSQQEDIVNQYDLIAGKRSSRTNDIVSKMPFQANCDSGFCKKGAFDHFIDHTTAYDERDQIKSKCKDPVQEASTSWKKMKEGILAYQILAKQVLSLQSIIFDVLSQGTGRATFQHWQNTIQEWDMVFWMLLDNNAVSSKTMSSILIDCLSNTETVFPLEQKCSGACNYAYAMGACSPPSENDGRVNVVQHPTESESAKACQDLYDDNHAQGFGTGGLWTVNKCKCTNHYAARDAWCGAPWSCHRDNEPCGKIWGEACKSGQNSYLLASPEYCASSTCRDLFSDDNNWIPTNSASDHNIINPSVIEKFCPGNSQARPRCSPLRSLLSIALFAATGFMIVSD